MRCIDQRNGIGWKKCICNTLFSIKMIALISIIMLMLLGSVGLLLNPRTASLLQNSLAYQVNAQRTTRCFDETGYCIGGRIREFWEHNDGLRVFGYPISTQQEEVVEGTVIQVQWFERNRLELHPQNHPPYDVLLGRIGADRLAATAKEDMQPLATQERADCLFFTETNINVCGEFLNAWKSSGLEFDGQPVTTFAESQALYGLPLSSAQRMVLHDGKSYTVQWFERARFELHPENQPPYQVLTGLLGKETIANHQTNTHASPTPMQATQRVRFAVIGDFGLAGQPEEDVANLVKSWQPDFIVTVGDNNYPEGSATTIDDNIGQYYHMYIAPYHGTYGKGATTNRFYPVLGNHDVMSNNGQPYYDYFTLPGNERYYTVLHHPVELFALNSMPGEQDGVDKDSMQAQWLQQQLSSSTACWKLVIFHHAPFSSALHGASTWMQWPFQAWGADAVVAGHDHTYERIMQNGFPYIVNGLGGGARYTFPREDERSVVRYNADHGAMLVEATKHELTFQFINRVGDVIDRYAIEKACH